MPLRSRPPRAAALAVATLLAAVGLPAAAEVEVRWLQPEQFSDAGRSPVDRERTMQTLGSHFARLGERLPVGQTLQVDVLDVDLAGELEPFRWNDARVLRGRVDGPHLSLRYRLHEGGRTLREGRADLSALGYLHELRTVVGRNHSLAHEKRLVERWFGETFDLRQAPPDRTGGPMPRRGS